MLYALTYLTGHQKVTGCTHMLPSLVILFHEPQLLEHLTGDQKVAGFIHTI